MEGDALDASDAKCLDHLSVDSPQGGEQSISDERLISTNNESSAPDDSSRPCVTLRCNTRGDFVRREEAADVGEVLNARFYALLCRDFDEADGRPQPGVQGERERLESDCLAYRAQLASAAVGQPQCRDATSEKGEVIGSSTTANGQEEIGPKPTTTVTTTSASGCPPLYHMYSPGVETYSRKVFIGGLPADLNEAGLVAAFAGFGPLSVGWPSRAGGSKGYAFLVFAHEMSVRLLCQACFLSDDADGQPRLRLYMRCSAGGEEKAVEVRPWRMADADYVVQPSMPVELCNAVFVGGLPRFIKAVELARAMELVYGPVACAGIDVDVELKYPKGAGRVVFFSHACFLRAIKQRYVTLCHGEIEKRMELKPYVLDDQPCDECAGDGGAVVDAAFFCPDADCLQYYCEGCWATIHAQVDYDGHRPLVKEA